MKPSIALAIVIFAIVAVLHLLRILMGWDVTIGSFGVSMWVSYFALIITAGLAFILWRESSRKKQSSEVIADAISSPLDQTQVVLAERKLSLLLEVADQILPLFQAALVQLNQAIERQSISMTRRNQVLIGLWLKAGGTFESLVTDARLKRTESSHHLKTMVEAFIYSHWVSQDQGEQRASLIIGEGYRGLAVTHANSEEPNAEQYAQEWRNLQSSVLNGLREEFKQFKARKLEGLADDCGLDQHYDRIYRFACEVAHIADLSVYMPPDPSGSVSFAPRDLSLLRAYLCLRDGLRLACDLSHDASDVLVMQDDQHIDQLRQRITTIIRMGS